MSAFTMMRHCINIIYPHLLLPSIPIILWCLNLWHSPWNNWILSRSSFWSHLSILLILKFFQDFRRWLLIQLVGSYRAFSRSFIDTINYLDLIVSLFNIMHLCINSRMIHKILVVVCKVTCLILGEYQISWPISFIFSTVHFVQLWVVTMLEWWFSSLFTGIERSSLHGLYVWKQLLLLVRWIHLYCRMSSRL